MLFLSNIDLSKNELQNARIQNLATAPGTPVQGQIYFNTTDKNLYIWDGLAWDNLTAVPADWNTLANKPSTFPPPIATAGTLGGVKAGANLTIAGDGTISAGTAASKNTGTAAGNVPILDAGGKLDTGILPSLAISDTFIVADQTAMLALTAEVGDVAVRTDLSRSFILKTSPASTLANWVELATPTDVVQSVAGKTGVVILVKGDVGLGNVDNESKATMFTNAALTGVPTAPTAATATNTTQIATTAYVKAQGYLTVAPVTTVAGRTGAVVLTSADVGLGNVENKSSATIRNEITSINVISALAYTPAKRLSMSLGNGVATTFTFSHSLATTELVASVREVATGNVVYADIQIPNSSDVRVTFATAPTTNQYTLTIIG